MTQLLDCAEKKHCNTSHNSLLYNQTNNVHHNAEEMRCCRQYAKKIQQPIVKSFGIPPFGTSIKVLHCSSESLSPVNARSCTAISSCTFSTRSWIAVILKGIFQRQRIGLASVFPCFFVLKKICNTFFTPWRSLQKCTVQSFLSAFSLLECLVHVRHQKTVHHLPIALQVKESLPEKKIDSRLCY